MAVTQVVLQATVAGTVEAFDQDAYATNLAVELGISTDEIALDVSAASVLVVATIRPTSAAQLAAVESAAAALSRSPDVSALLGVEVVAISEPVVTTVVVDAPSPAPPSPRVPPLALLPPSPPSRPPPSSPVQAPPLVNGNKTGANGAGEEEASGGSGSGSGEVPPSQCLNTCSYAADGDCDDGGPVSEYASCALGTDCVDCGSRVQSPSPSPSPSVPVVVGSVIGGDGAGGGGDAISAVASSSVSAGLVGGLGAGVAGLLLLVGACVGRRYVRSKGVLSLRRVERKPLPARRGYSGAMMMPVAPLSASSTRHKTRRPRAAARMTKLTQLLNPRVNVGRKKRQQQALLLSAISCVAPPSEAATSGKASTRTADGGPASLEKEAPSMPAARTAATARPRRPTGVNYSCSSRDSRESRESRESTKATGAIVVAARTSSSSSNANNKEAAAGQRLSTFPWLEAARESTSTSSNRRESSSNRVEPMLVAVAEPSPSQDEDQQHHRRSSSPPNGACGGEQQQGEWKPTGGGVVASLRMAASVVLVPDHTVAVTSASTGSGDGLGLGLGLLEVAVIVDKPIDITAAAVAQQSEGPGRP